MMALPREQEPPLPQPAKEVDMIPLPHILNSVTAMPKTDFFCWQVGT